MLLIWGECRVRACVGAVVMKEKPWCDPCKAVSCDVLVVIGIHGPFQCSQADGCVSTFKAARDTLDSGAWEGWWESENEVGDGG